MKNILQNWTISRFLYLAAGIFFILVAVNDRVWFMIPFGLYFAAMALFRFGCASGTCDILPNEDINHSK
ncbi:hypothetical protein [Kaistella polysaccharea]|uniref:hypothetical protein n=1 Tax=Kaistella polysaccharea TaxID=2878534 RepID=UPI001CF51427|nr:hypothetical protein [Kaistella polysaccharea]